MTPFAAFESAYAAVEPRVAVVLGSGLGGVAQAFREHASVGYADVPGVPPPTVAGHRGRLAVGDWDGVPALVCSGRVHFYEGHPWDRVTRLVELAADLGVRAAVLTNAAGGIRADLNPGDVMAIRAHLALLGRDAWRTVCPETGPYTPALVAAAETAGLPTGVYAGLTGPAYETHAEVRALRLMGADAVGMSTVREALAAAARGLQVCAVSCVTNKAAGLAPDPLTHADVEAVARAAVARVTGAVGALVRAAAGV